MCSLTKEKKVNDLGEMQAYQLATKGTAIGWDWRRRGSNNNFVLRKRSPLMPSPIRVDINYFFHSFFRLFFILVLFCLTGLPRLISYVPGTGPQALFGDASLSICQKTSCEPESIEVIETSVFKALIFAMPDLRGQSSDILRRPQEFEKKFHLEISKKVYQILWPSQLWPIIYWGNWNVSLQSLDFCIAFACDGRVGKVQIFWEGLKSLKKIST